MHLGQLCNHCLPERCGHSVRKGGGGEGERGPKYVIQYLYSFFLVWEK